MMTFHQLRKLNYSLYQQHRRVWQMYTFWSTRGNYTSKIADAHRLMLHYQTLAFAPLAKQKPTTPRRPPTTDEDFPIWDQPAISSRDLAEFWDTLGEDIDDDI